MWRFAEANNADCRATLWQHDSRVQASMQRTGPRLTGAAFLLIAVALSPSARSEPTSADRPNARERAATEYDRGVHAYDRGDYPVAAEAFLAADTLVPNDDALANAIAAARRAHDKRLLEETGTRGLLREHAAPELGELARAALVEAASIPDSFQAAASTRSAPTPAATATPTLPTKAPAPPPVTTERDRSHGWSPAVFYAGAGVTLVLTSVIVWSGIDTLHAYHRLPGTQQDNDEVKAREHRTDALLAATLVAAGATAFIGLRLVAWSPRTELATSVSPRAAALTLRGVF
jgi:hypothetical protein